MKRHNSLAGERGHQGLLDIKRICPWEPLDGVLISDLQMILFLLQKICGQLLIELVQAITSLKFKKLENHSLLNNQIEVIKFCPIEVSHLRTSPKSISIPIFQLHPDVKE
jgi:hypothetical protein